MRALLPVVKPIVYVLTARLGEAEGGQEEGGQRYDIENVYWNLTDTPPIIVMLLGQAESGEHITPTLFSFFMIHTTQANPHSKSNSSSTTPPKH